MCGYIIGNKSKKEKLEEWLGSFIHKNNQKDFNAEICLCEIKFLSL